MDGRLITAPGVVHGALLHENVETESPGGEPPLHPCPLLLVAAGVEEPFKGYDLLAELHFLWKNSGVFQDLVPHPEFLGNVGKLLPHDRLSLEGEVVKLSPLHRFPDLSFRYQLQNAHFVHPSKHLTLWRSAFDKYILSTSNWGEGKPEMIETKGDLWMYLGKAAIAITTNGQVSRRGEAIFGRGCAREARERFPDLPRRLGELISQHGNHVHLLEDGLVSFPVEHSPFENPDIRLIERSARELVEMADREGWGKVVVPRPGCGGGGLSWREVRPLLERIFDDRFLVIAKEDAE